VGIIMYMPTADPAQRQAVTDAFTAYRRLAEEKLYKRFGAHVHWAKLEVERPDRDGAASPTVSRPTASPAADDDNGPPAAGGGPSRAEACRAELRERFPVAEFNALRARLDPKGILSNSHVDAFFGGAAVVRADSAAAAPSVAGRAGFEVARAKARGAGGSERA
jgi:L-galactono-1,4-lactone dehydrogenase